jgi:cysteine synthase
MRVAESLVDLVGDTPLLRLARLFQGAPARVLGKLEFFNPASSVKDRTGLSMVMAAERSGKLKPGMTIVEPTSGNTGIALAWIAAVRGYKLILTMPESMSKERRKLLGFLGATVVLTPAVSGMGGAVAKANEILASMPDGFMPMQFNNPANPAVHRATTGSRDLARHRWASGCVRGGRGHRRHHLGRGRVPEEAQAGCARGGHRTTHLTRAVRGKSGPALDSGHWRGIRARNLQ